MKDVDKYNTSSLVALFMCELHGTPRTEIPLDFPIDIIARRARRSDCATFYKSFLLSAQYYSKRHERAPSITVSSIMFPNERALHVLAASRHVLGKVFLCFCNMPGPHYRSKIEKRKCKNFLNLWRRSDWNQSRSCVPG